MPLTFSLRFDFRNPAFAGTKMADRYAAALDMAAWADGLGCASIGVAEHHFSPDGYLPSPIPLLAALSARTSTTRFMAGALIAPFHDPIRVAEDFCVLDNLSRGRVDLIVAGGYVHEEFAQFAVPMSERAKRVTEMVTTLKAAFRGQPFEYRGRTIHITPAPYSPTGPRVLMGGSSEPAARRAARIADGFLPSAAKIWDFYRDERQRLGHPDPGPAPMGEPATYALARNPEEAWPRMAPFFLHETNAYGAWQAQDNVESPYRTVRNEDELRATGRYLILTPAQMIAQLRQMPVPHIGFHPLCGGMPISLAWDSLKLFEREVLPAFA